MRKKAILFIGLPGSGKTTIVEERYSSDYQVVSADLIKQQHPDYDPNNTEPLHEWSVAEAEREMNALSDEGKDICMDSGGVNNSYSLRIIGMLKSKGYHITLVYVDTPLDVCLERNRERLRKVPESAILEKSKRICSCLEKQMVECDEFIHIQYDKDKNIVQYKKLRNVSTSSNWDYYPWNPFILRVGINLNQQKIIQVL